MTTIIKTDTSDMFTGEHTFTDQFLSINGHIYGRIIHIQHPINISLSISCYNDAPVAKFLLNNPPYYDEEPINETDLATAMHALFQYAHQKIPTLTEIRFDDTLSIDTDNIYPIPLCYVSIAFTGKTWYELQFGATQDEANKHEAYRDKINSVLYLPDTKRETTFFAFLEIAQPPVEIVEELREYYDPATTYSAFFKAIPANNRERLVYCWIKTFMRHYLGDVFSPIDWIIRLPISVSNCGQSTEYILSTCGLPSCRMLRNKSYHALGVSPEDV